MKEAAWYQKMIAEAVGPFILTFAGVGAIVAAAGGGAGGLVAVALAHGLALGIAVYATAAVSGGHLNPAVTVAMWVTHRIGAGMAALYLAAQLAGAALGAWLVKLLFPPAAVAAVQLGATLPGPGVSAVQAMGLEAVLTFFLVFVVFATAADSRAAPGVYGFAIGLTVAFDILAGGPFTGASMNPARSFGPELVLMQWRDWWVYWAGPLLGGIVAGLLYDGLLMDRAESRIRPRV